MKRANRRRIGRADDEARAQTPDPDPAGEAERPITDLLRAWSRGTAGAEGELFDRIYPELKRIAAARLRSGRGELSLAPTDVVHETFLRLVPQRAVHWTNRQQFFAVSARIVRRVLIDQLRRRRSRKRGGAVVHVSVEQVEPSKGPPDPDLLALDALLEQLETIDPIAVRVIELRYFSGLTIDDAAEALRISRTSVVCKWRAARGWLRQRLTAVADDGD